jgi:hypothetical protein
VTIARITLLGVCAERLLAIDLNGKRIEMEARSIGRSA